MLSQHDRRTLADIENHLRDSDPALASMLEGSPGPASRGRRLRRRISLAGLLLGLVLLATAFAARSADVAVSAIVVLVAVSVGAALCMVSWFRHYPG